MADIQTLQVQIATIQAQIATLNQQQNVASAAGDQALVQQIAGQVASLAIQLTNLQDQLQQLQLQGVLPTASTGQVAQEDNTAPSQNPPTSTVTVGANGRVTSANAVPNSSYVGVDGTAAQTLSITNSQQPPFVTKDDQGYPLPPTTAQAYTNPLRITNDDQGYPLPSAGVGVGAAPEDNTKPNTNTTQQTINSTFGAPITPQANILDQYVSYTYSISWYLITPNQFKALKNSRNTAGWQLLIQSGGAAVTAPNTTTAGRNQYFSLDYYLDNLVIHSVAMKGTGLAHNATDISFTVTEPNGITLIQTLYTAVSNLWKNNPTQYAQNSAPNYISNPYCLVIRFYGYDENGNLVTVGKNSSTGKSAIVEKFYPFLLTDLTFRVANKAVEYAIKAKPLPYSLNLSQNRGTIPFNYELVGSTVDDVLNGRAVTATVPTDPGRTTSPQPQTSAPSVVGNTVTSTTTPTPANASNAYVDSTGVDFGQLSG